MNRFIRRTSTVLFAIALSLLCLAPRDLLAQQQHVVNPADLQKEMVSASSVREQNEATLNKLLTHEETQKVFRDAHVNSDQVKAAIHSLDDQELARLTAQANQAQHDIDAGMSAGLATLIIIAVVILVVVILVVSL
jgi:CHASE3 domain sensor protein